MTLESIWRWMTNRPAHKHLATGSQASAGRLGAAVWGLALMGLLGTWAPATAEERPNLLLVYVDDLGWKDVGFMGSDFYETPHLDHLASQGLVFRHAYSCAANCAPARACLLSGQYTPRHKIYNVGTGPRGKNAHRRLKHVPGVDTLDPQITTWAKVLQDAGYRTATMGKWHLSDDPLPYGFDVNIGGTHSGGPPKGYYPPHPNAPGLQDAPADEYVTDRLSDEACRFIEANRQQPWMLYLTHFAVHTPLNAKRELVAKYEAKQPGELHDHVPMATMIQSVDDGLGKILATLERLQLRDRTVVMFYSDNGGYGPATDMAPLRGYKGTYYEGGIRVPFMVSWPGKIDAGVTDEPIIGVDLFPTFCELAGVEPPEQPLDGTSLVPVWTGQRPTVAEDGQPRTLYWHFPAYLQSYNPRCSDEQRDVLFRSRPCSTIRQGRWKFIEYFESGDTELFDLVADPGESRNLAASDSPRASQLQEALHRWQQSIGADIPTELNPNFDAQAEAQAIAQMKRKANQERRNRRP